jgi:CxxC motif-containing protein (DUF1111 family)
VKYSYPAWCLIAALLVFVPVGWRVATWPRPEPPETGPDMVRAGAMLFSHDWQPNDPLCAKGDGLGPVYNATSCVACHNQGGAGGGGDRRFNVLTFAVRPDNASQAVREGVIHNHAVSPKYQETLKHIDSSLPAMTTEFIVNDADGLGRAVGRQAANVRFSQRNTPALFGAGLIDAIPDRVVLANARRQRLRHGMAAGNGDTLPVGRALRLPDGRVGKFGWKAQTATLAEFVQAACANELGLGNPTHAQPRPLGSPDYQPVGLDLTLEQCNQMTAFVASLPRPVERNRADEPAHTWAAHGKTLFSKVGCADCHTPSLGSVSGIYSDLLLHRMGEELTGEGSSYGGAPSSPRSEGFASQKGPRPDEWRTPPLWGVADSAPYLHDGRAKNLEEAIQAHGGQGARAANAFTALRPIERQQLLAFLRTLRAP